MSSSVTLSPRSVVVGLLGALALAGAYILGTGNGGSAVATEPPSASAGSAAPDATRSRTITMTGQGEATAVPDQLAFRVSVTTTRTDVPDALDASTATLNRVLAALDRLGIQRKDTQSTGLSIDPEYRYFDYAPPQITGYRVRQSLSVLVRDLRTGGEAITAVAGAGGNAVRVSDIGLRVGDRDAALAEARDAAVKAATAKAKQYAEATGQSLGDVLTLKEGHRASRPRPVYKVSEQRAITADSLAVPIRAGREDVEVTVAIVWALS
jgi:uncharacterized protein YggE